MRAFFWASESPSHFFDDRASTQASLMWLVSDTYFCTSENLLVHGTSIGFSWPLIVPVCRPVKTSEKAMVVGLAPSFPKKSVQSGLPGTRIFRPFRSAGSSMGRTELVISRPVRVRKDNATVSLAASLSFSTWPGFPARNAASSVVSLKR